MSEEKYTDRDRKIIESGWKQGYKDGLEKGRADERKELLKNIIQELDILNHQGGGIDDILVYLHGLKENRND